MTQREVKSVGAEITFETDYSDIEIIKSALKKQVERVCYRLKRDNINGKTITIKVKYSDFTQITRSITLSNPTIDLNQIYILSENLLTEKTEAGVRKVRLIGVSLSNLNEKESSPGLFNP